MKLLLHTCCGPCTIYPLSILKRDHDVTAYFFNPNIHPFKEFTRRKNTLVDYCRDENIPLLDPQPYGLKEFLRKVVHQEKNRCQTCYTWRLRQTAQTAAELDFTAFTTTLLYSQYQNHAALKKCAEELAGEFDIEFYYYDFREGWQEGIDKSRQKGMYRQPYCGCVYSEQERYDKKLRKK